MCIFTYSEWRYERGCMGPPRWLLCLCFETKLRSCSVAQVDLELVILLLQPPEWFISFYIRQTRYTFCFVLFQFLIWTLKNGISLCSYYQAFLIHRLNHNIESIGKMWFIHLSYYLTPSSGNRQKFGKHMVLSPWSASRSG